MTYSKKRIITALKQYPARKRNVGLLRFELEHIKEINEDDVIQSLALGEREFGGGRSGHISDKTQMIAMQYKDIRARINSDTRIQIARELRTIESEVERLERYVSLLSEREAEVIRLRYFEEQLWQDIETKCHVGLRTLRKRHDAGIDTLAEMYGFMEEIADMDKDK